MIVKSFSSLTEEELKKFYNFCQHASVTSKDPASKNMWGNENYTLPYLLNTTNRFDGQNGDFFILFYKNTVVACSGIYKSEFSNDVAIAGVRTWIHNSYRNKLINREHLLPFQKAWAIKNNFKIIALTFNEYNKNIIKIFKRNRLGEKNNRIYNRLPKHLFYNGFCEVKFPVVIQYTKQWIVYEKLDLDYDFDWTIIMWNNI